MHQKQCLDVGFLPRDAMRKRGPCCRKMSVCPSVRHTPVLCLNDRHNIILKPILNDIKIINYIISINLYNILDTYIKTFLTFW